MDLYVYDSDFKQVDILDDYDSLIWTERYGSFGDTQITAADTPRNRLSLLEDNFLQIPDSDEAIQIRTFNAKDGVITVKGSTLTSFLSERFVKRSWANTQNYVQFNGNPVSAIYQLIRNYAMLTTGYMGQGVVTNEDEGVYELFPNLQIAQYNLDNLDLLDLDVPLQIPQGTLYDAIKYVTDLFNLGFKLYPANITNTDYDLFFEVYEGKDRTSGQTKNEVVSFQSALERLTDVEEIRSKENYKNVAWAYATNIAATDPYVGVAYADATAKRSTGFKRRTLFVDVSDIQAADVDLTTLDGQAAFRALLNYKAKNGLINNTYVRMADGTIVPQDDCVYGIHYGLGDVVELISDGGIISSARVTEYIYSVGPDGLSAYPTLSAVS